MPCLCKKYTGKYCVCVCMCVCVCVSGYQSSMLWLFGFTFLSLPRSNASDRLRSDTAGVSQHNVITGSESCAAKVATFLRISETATAVRMKQFWTS